jgi:uncharacterized lipoprotein YmbA
MRIVATIIAFIAGIGLLGCSPLAPQPDHSKFFLLNPISEGTASSSAAAANTSQLVLGVGPISFPGYLSRLEVVTLASPNQIDLSSEKRWGEPLDRNFTRVLTENLTRLLDTQKVEKYPWPRNNHVDYQVVVDVQRFEANSQGQSQLTARWIIKDGANGKDLYASETRATSAVAAGETGPSAALSQDLATLSREIASRISELSQQRPAPRASAADRNSRS